MHAAIFCSVQRTATDSHRMAGWKGKDKPSSSPLGWGFSGLGFHIKGNKKVQPEGRFLERGTAEKSGEKIERIGGWKSEEDREIEGVFLGKKLRARKAKGGSSVRKDQEEGEDPEENQRKSPTPSSALIFIKKPARTTWVSRFSLRKIFFFFRLSFCLFSVSCPQDSVFFVYEWKIKSCGYAWAVFWICLVKIGESGKRQSALHFRYQKFDECDQWFCLEW